MIGNEFAGNKGHRMTEKKSDERAAEKIVFNRDPSLFSEEPNRARWSVVSNTVETRTVKEKNPTTGAERTEKVTTSTRSVEINPADVIAWFSGVVAVLFAIGMLAGWIPIDKLTITVVSLAAVTPVLAQLVKASARRR